MSQSELTPDAAARIAALPSLPRDTGGPVFAEPWEAQAFALAVKLSQQGHFTWKEWASALAAELKAAADRGEGAELATVVVRVEVHGPTAKRLFASTRAVVDSVAVPVVEHGSGDRARRPPGYSPHPGQCADIARAPDRSHSACVASR